MLAPDQSPRLTLRDAGLAAFFLVAVILAGGLVLPRLPFSESQTGLLGATLLHAGMLGATLWTLKRRRLDGRALFGLTRPRLAPATLSGLAAALVFIPFLLPITAVWILLLKQVGLDGPPQSAVRWLLDSPSSFTRTAFILEAGLLAPLAEELFFRGVMEGGLREKLPLLTARFGTAALFASIHFHLPGLLPLFIVALAFSALYHDTRSLAGAVAMHAAYNLVNIAWILVATPS